MYFNIQDCLKIRSIPEPSFRKWVLDVKDELETVSNYLNKLDADNYNLDLYSRTQLQDEAITGTTDYLIPLLDSYMKDFSHIVGDFAGCRANAHEWNRVFLKYHLWYLVGKSPLLRRAQEKPLGYAGDYEMMNMLYRPHAEGDTTFGKAMNVLAASLPVAQANINRIDYLNGVIDTTINRISNPRITSVGSGPAREIEVFFDRINCNCKYPSYSEKSIQVTLFDQEPRAIAQCRKNILPKVLTTNSSLCFIESSIKKILGREKLIKEQDLIYSAGLFDYFSDKAFLAFAQKLLNGLVSGGQLVIGNVALHNPSRLFMEYFTEWFLVHRSKEDLLNLADQLTGVSHVSVGAENSGINLFLYLTKN